MSELKLPTYEESHLGDGLEFVGRRLQPRHEPTPKPAMSELKLPTYEESHLGDGLEFVG